ncbi:MAG: OmpH family outer membrane protein [Akkermansiaceae bacterium]|jgi:outer membrane protein
MTLFRRLFTIALATSLISVASAQNLRVATVDMQELFKQYHLTIAAQDQIDFERAKINQSNEERLVRIKEIESNLENFKKQIEDPSVNESKKQSLAKDFKLQQQEGIQLDKERREFIQRRNEALNQNMIERMKSILDDIRKLVEERSKADNYDLVIDKSGTSISQVPVLLYSKDSMDITASLLKVLNKDAPAPKKPEDKKTEGKKSEDKKPSDKNK